MASAADLVAERVASRQADTPAMPRYPTTPGHTKLSAAWLVERAGFARGYTEGTVGLSSRHALAIVNRGGARAADVVALASKIRLAVRDALGVALTPEPELLGFAPADVAALRD